MSTTNCGRRRAEWAHVAESYHDNGHPGFGKEEGGEGMRAAPGFKVLVRVAFGLILQVQAAALLRLIPAFSDADSRGGFPRR
jgi:hypothetical protein